MDGRMLAGVSSGLGAYFNVDPVVFRVAFVALTIPGGVGVFIYLLCWALFPPAYGPNATPAVGAGGGQQAQALLQGALREGGWKTFLAIGAILLAVVLLFSPFTRPSVVFALVLIALGVLLLIRDQPGDVRQPGQPGPGGPPPPGAGPAPTGGFPTGQPEPQGQWQTPASPPPPAAAAPEATVPGAAPEPAAEDERVAAGVAGSYGTSGSAPAVWGQTAPWGQPGGWGQTGAWGQPPSGGHGSATERSGWGSAATAVMETVRQPRPRAIVGWVTVALAFLAAGVAGAFDNFGVVHMSVATTLALMLTVIGAGLMVASMWGRAGWLILVGLLLLPGVLVSSVVRDVGFSGEAGERTEAPASAAAVLPLYRLGGGDLRIDLSAVRYDPKSTPPPIRANVGAGELTVIVPKGQPVQVNARVSAGQIEIFGSSPREGLDVRTSVTDPLGTPEARLLVLDLRVGAGTITVQRGERPATSTTPTSTSVPTSRTR
jgi:phage shock protein PspC (stress-responsive transcriptional regulator)